MVSNIALGGRMIDVQWKLLGTSCSLHLPITVQAMLCVRAEKQKKIDQGSVYVHWNLKVTKVLINISKYEAQNNYFSK